jgi:glycosyltransferase involved in cell wall biosynthesis
MREFAGEMKVAIVAYGHADNVICLANHLAEYIDITLIFVTTGDRFTRSIFDWDISNLPYGLTTDSTTVNRYIGERILRYINPNLKIYIARIPTLKILKDWKRQNIKYIKQMSDYILHNGYDVVHFNGSSGFQLYFHYYFHRMPKVYTIHDYLPHSGEGTKRLNFINTRLKNLYAKLDYEFIQHYEFLAHKFSEFYRVPPNRVHTVYCGPFDVYRVFVNKKVAEEPNTILFFGRISRYKGIEYLLHAIPQVKAHIPDIKVIIAGKGDFEVDVSNNGEYEIYNHHVSNEELVNLIQRASIVVMPYTDATHSAVLMTAYAFNKPVVASAVGGIPEVIENNVTGKLVQPKNPQALAANIIDLLSKYKKRELMKKNIEAKFTSGKQSWDFIARQTIGIYKKAMFG